MVIRSMSAKVVAAFVAVIAAIALVATLAGRTAGGTLRELRPDEQAARLGRLWEDCNSSESCTEKNGGSASCPGLVVKGRCVPLSPSCMPDPACSNDASATRCGFAWFDSCDRVASRGQLDCGFVRRGICASAGATCVCTSRKVDVNRKCSSIQADECR